MEINNKNIFFIGFGKMAAALAKGMLDSGAVKKENVFFNDIVRTESEYGFKFAEKENGAANADIIFLSVKPGNIEEVLKDIKDYIKKNTLIISIAAGISTKFIEDVLNKDAAVVRAMPNTPAMVLSGATALSGGRFISGDDLETAKSLLSAVGKAEVVEEDMIDAITALSGSGPAYVFYLCELMQQAAEKLGLKENIAKEFAVQTVYGAGKMLKETGVAAAKLRENVTSPNGTTQAALEYFKSQNLAETVQKAMEQAAGRSRELSK